MLAVYHPPPLCALHMAHLLPDRPVLLPLSGRHAPAVPRSKRMLSDEGSNILVRASTSLACGPPPLTFPLVGAVSL
jgi:hypothetical protein